MSSYGCGGGQDWHKKRMSWRWHCARFFLRRRDRIWAWYYSWGASQDELEYIKRRNKNSWLLHWQYNIGNVAFPGGYWIITTCIIIIINVIRGWLS
jgi:hypothetical protein